MMPAALKAHLETGHTTLCRCWAVKRSDGVMFGFTDHDCDLTFDEMQFKANSGLSAQSLQQATGLSIDNTEAIGALSDAAVNEADIDAGRFDGAEVRAWLVNWADVSQRMLQFRGHMGEIRRAGGAFQAELRGLTEQLNRPLGRVYQKPCTAVLGDSACGFDLTTPGYSTEVTLGAVREGQIFVVPLLEDFEPDWFRRGVLRVISGAGAGLWGAIKGDLIKGGTRTITLWESLRANIQPGDQVRLTAGCDRRFETCRLKFNNALNYQGFPDIPGEDWLMAVPRQENRNTGGSRR
ncbi:phage conserved hypothetical protein BR0599 [Epibacterium ulvae]|uniref:Bacteriophage phiJL001 Gp84 C-terminal domain-containing protein n=1 Tax=Epibacterium ulvae TaxID=1156985 RepID=A0A1G5RC64_9RHOB|nr:DUF2163 domain-containing protein [Epibacterium ulvae]SCZ71674.1 phage conserved hypothetical protein BR0599 [Epibacterium ulvae]